MFLPEIGFDLFVWVPVAQMESSYACVRTLLCEFSIALCHWMSNSFRAFLFFALRHTPALKDLLCSSLFTVKLLDQI